MINSLFEVLGKNLCVILYEPLCNSYFTKHTKESQHTQNNMQQLYVIIPTSATPIL